MNQNNKTQNKIKLSVIVLFYFGERWIEGCIRSLEKQSLSRSAYEIILVDNGGSTPSVDNYEGAPNTKVLHFLKNYGFAGGNNKALAHAEGEFIVLMNQDVLVHFNCLEKLITTFEDYPQAGVVSANMLMISSNDHPNRHSAIYKTVGLYKLSRFGYASYFTQEPDEDLIPVEIVSGNAMCFRRCILNDVGNYLFDARLKSYAEDLDLSIRLRKTKWEMCVHPKAVVYHYRDEAFSGSPLVRLRKLTHISSNRLLVYFNNLSWRKFLIRLPALLWGIPSKVSRPDGASKFHFGNFLLACSLIPFIFVYFWYRVFQISKTPKTILNHRNK
jgi:GT2 family glycosyltransferase